MPISELRQTVRNLHSDASQLEALIGSGGYGTDIILIYNQLCDSIYELNAELEELEGTGESISLRKYSAA